MQHRFARWSVCSLLPKYVIQSEAKDLSTFTLCVTEILPPSGRLDDIIIRAKRILRPIKETPTSNSEAHLSPPLGDRPLVEEREEFFALSREEEKAV